MRTTTRLTLSTGLLALLAGCYGAPATEQPITAAPASVTTATGAPAVAVGYRCYAGAYICALPAYGPIGSGCSCPGLGAPSYGTIR